MGKVIASITTSVDGYVTGPDDGPVYGLGRGGERLHYWVMGGPWTYEGGHDFAMHGPDKEFYDELVSTLASGVVGRGMYDAAGGWGRRCRRRWRRRCHPAGVGGGEGRRVGHLDGSGDPRCG